MQLTLSMIPVFHPRFPSFVLGLTIGLSIALMVHWITWTIRGF